MREILFRGKRLDNSEWVSGSLVVWNDGSASIDTGKPDEPKYAVSPATVGAYTGLIDKNGKKIFEGDIFRYEKRDYVVQWDDEGGYTIFCDSAGCAFDCSEIEIIGNIHDNPELLREE